MLVQLMNDKKYNMRKMYLIGFPLLYKGAFIHSKIVAKKMPKLDKHMVS